MTFYGNMQSTWNILRQLNGLLNEFDFLHPYIDDLIILNKVDWTYHSEKNRNDIGETIKVGTKVQYLKVLIHMKKTLITWFSVTCEVIKPIYIK